MASETSFWPAKSRLVFEFKTRNRKYAIIAFRCDNSYTMLPDPFSRAFRGLSYETKWNQGRIYPTEGKRACNAVLEQNSNRV